MYVKLTEKGNEVRIRTEPGSCLMLICLMPFICLQVFLLGVKGCGLCYKVKLLSCRGHVHLYFFKVELELLYKKTVYIIIFLVIWSGLKCMICIT